jgi:hypothetical protein
MGGQESRPGVLLSGPKKSSRLPTAAIGWRMGEPGWTGGRWVPLWGAQIAGYGRRPGGAPGAADSWCWGEVIDLLCLPLEWPLTGLKSPDPLRPLLYPLSTV